MKEKNGTSTDILYSIRDQSSEPLTDIKSPPWYRCRRHIVPVLSFFAVFIMYIVRFALSQAIIPMSASMGWSGKMESFVQSAFYIGYVSTQLIGGYLSRIYGGKYVLSLGLLLSCVSCSLIPVLSFFYPAVILLRILMGVGQGVIYPGMVELLSQWVLPTEKTFLMSFAFSGGQAGTIFALGSYTYLSKWTTWQFPFYLYSAAGLIWAVAWLFLIYETPSVHPHLSSSERAVIYKYSSRSNENSAQNSSSKPAARSRVVPWKRLFTSYPIYVLAFAHFTYNWSFYLMMNFLPRYLNNILGFVHETQGLYAMTPYLGLWFTVILSGIITDFIIRRGMPVGCARKIMYSLGLLPCAVLLCLLPNFSESLYTTLGVLFVVICFPGIAISGMSPNSMDLSPEFASIITSLSNVVGSTAGILSPLVSGSLIFRGNCKGSYPETIECANDWFLAFRVGAIVYVVGVVVWIILSSSKPLKLTEEKKDELLEVAA